MNRDNNNSSTTSQTHRGPGDNVAGDKYVLQAISPVELHTPIQNILTSLRHRVPLQAREQLGTLKLTANLNADAIAALKIAALLLELADDASPAGAYQELASCLKATGDELCKDLAVSAQIRLDVKNGHKADARQRYSDLEAPGEYTCEAYFECVADFDELEAAFEEQKLRFSDIELCGLVRGELRVDNAKHALVVAEYLNSTFSSFNSRVLVALSEITLLDAEINRKHYWCITASLREELLCLCERFVNLLSVCKGKDRRVVKESVVLLQFVHGDIEHLSAACWSYIHEIEALLPDAAEQIRHVYEQHPQRQDGVLYKLERAQKDASFRKNIVDKITDSTDITTEDYTLLSNVGDKASIREWIASGGKISTADDFEADYIALDLAATVCNEDPRSVEELRQQASQFISDHKARLPNLYPPSLLDLVDKLFVLGLSSIVCELLKPLIADHDIWLSPMVHCYLNALLDSRQMMTLNLTLAEIDQSSWSAAVWQIKARQLDCQHDNPGAIESIEEAIRINPTEIYSWYLLIYLKKKSTNTLYIKEAFDRVPDDVFSKSTEWGYTLLAEMVVGGSFTRAESILIRWFIADPEASSVPFTNVYLNSLTAESVPEYDLSSSMGDCLGGVRYLSDGNEVVKLLVSDAVGGHHALLAASSPLGILLSEMVVGETNLHNMSDIKLLERLPPYIAAFRIASALRQAINDGTDSFHSFSLPDDPVEMFDSLQKKIIASNGGKDKVNAMPDIPLFMKGFRQGRLSPVKAAFVLLADKLAVKSPLPDFGETSPAQVVLDVYSVAYFALTGLSHGLLDSPIKTVLTTETKHYLNEWLRDLNREDYFSVGVHPGGGLWRRTSDDVQRETAAVQAAVNLFIDRSEVVTPNLVDLPPDILQVENFIDLSVLSSLRLSITNDIPWLCIDLKFAQLSKTSGYKIVNANQLITLLGKGVPLNEKCQGLYLHVTAGLPYPVTFDDMIQLSKSKETHDQYFLAELLRMYPNAFSDTDSAVHFLHRTLGLVLINSYQDGERLNELVSANPKSNGYVERIFNACCYASMQCKDGREAERKLAMLLAELFETFQRVESMTKLIQHMASCFVVGHFMSLSAINSHLEEFFKMKAGLI